MALLGSAAANAAMNAVLVASTTYHATTHTASPGTTGVNEAASPGRGSFTVAAASGGAVSNVATITMTNSGAVAQTHVGVFTASTGGTYQIGAALSSSVTAATITIAAGGLTFTAS